VQVEGVPVRLCNEPGCNRVHHAQGLCQRDYLRAQYHHQKRVGQLVAAAQKPR